MSNTDTTTTIDLGTVLVDLGTIAASFALGVAATIAFMPTTAPDPHLIGYGCEGSNGPIYAHSESDFPLCATITTIKSE